MSLVALLMRRFRLPSVSLPWLGGVLGTLVVVAVGVHLLHTYQVQRNVESFRVQALLARDHGETDKVAEYLHKFLALRPDDLEARMEYALSLEKLAKTRRQLEQAQSQFEVVLRADPSNVELRRKLVRMAMQLKQYSIARDHLDLLLQTQTEDAELERLMGECHQEIRDYPRAIEWLTRAVTHAPYELDSYVRLATCYRRLGKDKEADRTMKEMVERNRNSYQAYLHRAVYWQQAGQLGSAGIDLARARELGGDRPEILLASAELALAQGRLQDARGFLDLGVQLDPKNHRWHLRLAQVEVQAGRRSEALGRLRRGLSELPDHPELLWACAELLVDGNQLDEADEIITRLSTLSTSLEKLSYLRAALACRRGEWLVAARELEAIRPRIPPTELAMIRRVDLLLARCYEQLDNPDLQLAAYAHALNVDPTAHEVRLALAALLARMNRVGEAIEEYRKLLTFMPSVRLPLAQLLLTQNLRLPAAQRDWEEVERLLQEAARATPDSFEVASLQAELQLSRGRPEQAEKILIAARDRAPNNVAAWVALIFLVERRGQPDRALLLLEEARSLLGDSVDLRLAAIRLWMGRRGPRAMTALADLENGLERFTLADRKRLLQELAEGYLSLGATRTVERIAKHLAQLDPKNLRIRLQLFDLALERQDFDLMEQLVRELREAEGDSGFLWKYGWAALTVTRSLHGNPDQLAQARSLINELAAARPTWSRIALLEGALEELQGNLEQAADKYLRAIELGEQRPRVVQKTVQMLFERGRYLDADRVLRNLQGENAAISGDLQRLAAEVSLQMRDYDRALELARRPVEAGSSDYRDYLWLGQVLTVAGRRAEAEKFLRQAVTLNPLAPDAWVSLVQALATAGQKEKAVEVIRQAQSRLPEAQVPLVLAQCYELTGSLDQAEQQFLAVLKTNADDLKALRAAASFFLRIGRTEKAEALLLRMLEPRLQASDAEVAWARRGLALRLSTSFEESHFQEALKLLQMNLQASGSQSLEDLRALATVLATRASRRKEAIRLFEDLLSKRALGTEEQFLLARLYEQAQDWSRLRERMLVLLADEPDNPLFLAYFARILLQLKDRDQAAFWLSRLERLEPSSFRALEIRLHLLQQLKRNDEILARIREYVAGKDANVELAAALLDKLGLTKEAEEFYTKHLAQSKRPQSLMALIRYYIQQKRMPEALDLCERVWKMENCPAELAARASVAALRAAPPESNDFARVDQWLQAALRKDPQSIDLRLRLAELYDLQGRHQDIEAVYREILQFEPRHGIALNNLAWILAMRFQRGEEALQYINLAIERYGPAAELLDTRAAVYLVMGQARQAIADLQAALAQRSIDSAHLRLAQAFRQMNDLPAAREALRKGREAGFNPERLHPLEQAIHRELVQELEASP